MIKKLLVVSALCYSILLNVLVINAQTDKKFNPELWVFNPLRMQNSIEVFNNLNFKTKLTLKSNSVWTSQKKINNPHQLFLVYKSKEDENLMFLIGKNRGVFFNSKKLNSTESIDINGYNEEFGELLDLQFSGMENGVLWLNPITDQSNIFEIILVDKTNNKVNINEIRTYLSLKYGIDLIDTEQLIYRKKSLWENSNTEFNNKVFGIARFDYYNLFYDKSIHSKEQDLIVTSKNYLNEGEYILVGNNNKTLNFDSKSLKSNKQWLIQTNKRTARVDLSVPLDKLNVSENEFIEYELLSENNNKVFVYSGIQSDSLVSFKNVLVGNATSTKIQLKKRKIDLDIKVVETCEKIEFKINKNKTHSPFDILIKDDSNNIVLSSKNINDTILLDKTNTNYYDVLINYNNKKINKRISTTQGTLASYAPNKKYVLNSNNEVTINLRNVSNVLYRWYKHDKLIGQGNYITLKEEGNYHVVLSDKNCSANFKFSVSKSSDNQEWIVYPNPAFKDEDIQISFDLKKESNVDIAIYSNEGKLIRTINLGKLTQKDINIGALNLASGMYMVVAYIDELPQIKKVIIK